MFNPQTNAWDFGHLANGNPLRIVVCGEVNSGKSTVLNVLLRANVIPHYIGSPKRPPVLVHHRNEQGLFVQDGDLPPDPIDSLLHHDPARSAAHCIIHTDAAHLEGFDLIELPFLQDGKVSAQTLAVVASADILIWTTIASQAWRLTEKNIIEHFGKHRPGHAILAVTRADKLRSDRDAEKIRDRLHHETNAYFQDIVFIGGAPDRIEASSRSAEGWEASSGQALFAAIETHARQIRPPAAADEDSNLRIIDDFQSPPATLRKLAEMRNSVVDISDYRAGIQAAPQRSPATAEPVDAAGGAEPAIDPAPARMPEATVPSPAEGIAASFAAMPKPEAAFGAPPPLPASDRPAAAMTEAPAAAGLTLHDEDLEQVRNVIAETIPDFACVGVLRMRDGAEVTLVGDPRQGSALATLVRQIIIASTEGGGFETSSIILSDHCLTFQAAGSTGLTVFAMSRNATVNAGIARSAIMRFVEQVPAMPLG